MSLEELIQPATGQQATCFAEGISTQNIDATFCLEEQLIVQPTTGQVAMCFAGEDAQNINHIFGLEELLGGRSSDHRLPQEAISINALDAPQYNENIAANDISVESEKTRNIADDGHLQSTGIALQQQIHHQELSVEALISLGNDNSMELKNTGNITGGYLQVGIAFEELFQLELISEADIAAFSCGNDNSTQLEETANITGGDLQTGIALDDEQFQEVSNTEDAAAIKAFSLGNDNSMELEMKTGEDQFRELSDDIAEILVETEAEILSEEANHINNWFIGEEQNEELFAEFEAFAQTNVLGY
ncbi:hypothetical protein KP509_21G038600 [Ceratopteris richardii]|uniref:Uncharacterized protein n=1 Tax=Ceratopteris richardii TaxID=49495 RepID=A0A8T2SB11_CERRI|nr:hypothetical protein KP509_21G038600 [Ceratopteris richardii]